MCSFSYSLSILQWRRFISMRWRVPATGGWPQEWVAATATRHRLALPTDLRPACCLCPPHRPRPVAYTCRKPSRLAAAAGGPHSVGASLGRPATVANASQWTRRHAVCRQHPPAVCGPSPHMPSACGLSLARAGIQPGCRQRAPAACGLSPARAVSLLCCRRCAPAACRLSPVQAGRLPPVAHVRWGPAACRQRMPRPVACRWRAPWTCRLIFFKSKH